ncbi:Methylamine utilisation protein MauE [Rathayibacter oskolensis]|uniref:Methylamine utilisation protein MauE n=2 Tax=Rathayibacter oskolensis TaxID=1891671 RepID=A0A1X7MVD9_9MICO|nr:Methylamine utilisation protein MauE [Rathayibacter oskolensis]
MPEAILAIAGWAAGAVLVVSGSLKLGRAEAFRASLAALGLPALLSRRALVARVFPVVEIVLGLGVVLAPSPLHRAALAAAALLYAVFLVVAVRAALAPEPVDCECFGGLGESRMTGRTVVRNAVLLALALAGLAGPAPAALLAVPGSGVASPAASALAAALAAVVLVLVRDRRDTRAPAPAPQVAVAPSADGLELRTFSGERIALAEFAQPPTHLVFFSPNCISCHELVERFRWWPHGLREGEDLVPVLLGRPEVFAAHEVFAPLVEHALYDPDRTVAAALGRTSTPGHVRLDPAHPLGDGWTSGRLPIERLVLRPDFFDDVQAGRIGPDTAGRPA